MGDSYLHVSRCAQPLHGAVDECLRWVDRFGPMACGTTRRVRDFPSGTYSRCRTERRLPRRLKRLHARPVYTDVHINLLIADAHALIREGLRAMFADSDIAVMAEAAVPRDVEPLARDPAVDAVLLSVSWGTFRSEVGIEVLRDIRSERPGLSILMYSVYDWDDLIEKCRQSGANGYLVKGVDDRLLPKAIRAVYNGDFLWPGQRRKWRI